MSASKSKLSWAAHKNLRSACSVLMAPLNNTIIDSLGPNFFQKTRLVVYILHLGTSPWIQFSKIGFSQCFEVLKIFPSISMQNVSRILWPFVSVFYKILIIAQGRCGLPHSLKIWVTSQRPNSSFPFWIWLGLGLKLGLGLVNCLNTILEFVRIIGFIFLIGMNQLKLT